MYVGEIIYIDIIFHNTRCLKDDSTLQGAMLTLEEEIVPWEDPSEASLEYRIQLTKSLLYKVRFIVTYKVNLPYSVSYCLLHVMPPLFNVILIV